jgi:hypothetical protein
MSCLCNFNEYLFKHFSFGLTALRERANLFRLESYCRLFPIRNPSHHSTKEGHRAEPELLGV